MTQPIWTIHRVDGAKSVHRCYHYCFGRVSATCRGKTLLRVEREKLTLPFAAGFDTASKFQRTLMPIAMATLLLLLIHFQFLQQARFLLLFRVPLLALFFARKPEATQTETGKNKKFTDKMKLCRNGNSCFRRVVDIRSKRWYRMGLKC